MAPRSLLQAFPPMGPLEIILVIIVVIVKYVRPRHIKEMGLDVAFRNILYKQRKTVLLKPGAAGPFHDWLNDFKNPSIAHLVLPSGQPIESDSGKYWFMHNDESVRQTLTDALVRRCAPDDLVALSLQGPDNIQFKNKRKLYHSLKVLDELGKWRHLGLLPEFIAASEVIESHGKNFYEYVVSLNALIKQVLRDTGKHQLKSLDRLYCEKDLRRFIKRSLGTIPYGACPVCNSPQYGLPVHSVIARIDRNISWRSFCQDEVLHVNYIKTNAMFDFDSIEIGACSPDDIDAFCVAVGNDAYINARKKRRPFQYRVLTGVDLQDRSRRNLEKLFVEESR